MPVTIPPFTNVPAPNDPVASAWAQQLTQFAVDQIVSQPGTPASPNTELWYDTDDPGMGFPNMPRGYVGHALANNAEQTVALNATVDVTGCTVTWTADPTRQYKVSGVINVQTPANGSGVHHFNIVDGSNNVRKSAMIGMPSGDTRIGSLDLIESGLSGTQTRKLQLAVSFQGAGASTTIVNTAGRQAIIIVEDIGAAGQSGGGVWSDSFPRGMVGRVSVANNQTGIGTTTTDITGLTVTAPLVAGRLYLVTMQLMVTRSPVNGEAFYTVADASNTAWHSWTVTYVTSGGGLYRCETSSIIVQAATANHVFKGRASCNTGTVDIRNGALWVEDVGKA